MLSKNLFLSSVAFFVLVSLPLIGSVGASSAMWSQTYGGELSDTAHSVVQTSDGGYAVAGRSLFLKIDAFGNVEWNQTLRMRSSLVIVASDGGYVLGGENKIVKTDAYGNMEWNRTYEPIYSLVATSDGGYAIAGGVSDFWLAKTDADGNLEWSHRYRGERDDKARALVKTFDGGYAIAGSTYGYGYHDFWLFKTDAYGNMEWNQTYPGPGWPFAYSLVATSDGGYAIAGEIRYFENSDLDFWLVKTDENGNLEWNQTYGGTDNDMAYSLVETFDGGYAIAGETRSFGAGEIDFWLVKTDENGNLEWNQAYGGIGQERAFSLVATSDGGYLIAGDTDSLGTGGRKDFWLIKTDRYGNFQETTPPTISIVSPENKTYTINNVSLTFTVSEPTSGIGYSLDGQENVAIDGNTTLTELSDGSHSLTVYATDTAGNTGASETVYFSIEVPPPEPKTSEPFPITWIAAATAIIAIVGAILLIYLRKTRKQQ